MPVVTITTNVTKEQVPDNFVAEFAETVAQSMAQPVEAVSVILHTGVYMFRLGSTEPAAIIKIQDIQKFDDIGKNKQITSAVTLFVLTQLHLDPERIGAALVTEDPTKLGIGSGMLLSEKLQM